MLNIQEVDVTNDIDGLKSKLKEMIFEREILEQRLASLTIENACLKSKRENDVFYGFSLILD